MRLCWREGVAAYDCPAPESSEFYWPGVPKRVTLEDSDRDYQLTLEEACAFWNRELGTLVFTQWSDAREADVLVRLDDEPVTLGGWRAMTQHRIDVHGNIWALLTVSQSELMPTYVALTHELGHALGLAHDGHPGSIMYPERAGDDLQFVLSEADRARLRRMLGIERK